MICSNGISRNIELQNDKFNYIDPEKCCFTDFHHKNLITLKLYDYHLKRLIICIKLSDHNGRISLSC